MTPFSARVHAAMDVAASAHHMQYRKDRDHQIPYVSHVFGVAYLLAEFDFEEEVVIAGLLHDILEDQPAFAPDVEQFGPRVIELVQHVTEDKNDAGGQLRPWGDRKRDYIAHIRTAPPAAKAISCADKIHNMQSILLALDRGGRVWESLKANRESQLDRMHNLRAALADGWSHPLLDRFDAVLRELELRASGGASERVGV